MGITLAALLERPELLEAVRPTAAPPAGDRGVSPVDADRPDVLPLGRRGHRLHGVHLPKGSVLHLCIGAANRDPERWERPDEYDSPGRCKPSWGSGGPHICLGMHVARAEMSVGIDALLDRLPNLRLDPDAEPPRRSVSTSAASWRSRWCSTHMTTQGAMTPQKSNTRHHSLGDDTSRLPRVRRRGRLHLERCADAAADGDGPAQGRPRTSPLIFARDGDDYLVVASMGGAPMHPQWYLNLVADPHAEIQVKAERIPVVARTASPDEKPRLWQIVRDVWPNYDVYQSRTDRRSPS